MFDYIKPTQRDFDPDIYPLEVGTKNLSSDKSLEQISLDILNLPKSLKLNNGTVVVANIIPRDDENKIKFDEVSVKLHKVCKVNDISEKHQPDKTSLET